MKTILIQLDGKLPNLALMRIAAAERSRGREIELRHRPDREITDHGDERIFASAIFTRSAELVEKTRREWPRAAIGGTGVSLERLESVGIDTDGELDYAIYPKKWRQSFGFTQRGCRLRCPFCIVPRKEGIVASSKTIADIWRGDPWPREIVLLDNDFFGQDAWRDRIAELVDGRFRVNFNQGINIRFLSEEAAAALASVDYRDVNMRTRRLYTAWDNQKDEGLVERGLSRLFGCGVKPRHIMVYMLIGYWEGETEDDRLYRAHRLRTWGVLPYPMPYRRTRELVGFQRWIVGAYDKRVTWKEWKSARYNPRRVGRGEYVMEDA